MGDGVFQRGVDLVDLGEGLAVRQIQIVGGDEVRIAFGTPNARDHDSHQANQPAGLLEALVLAEAGVQIAQRRMEGVGLRHVRRELLRRGVGHVHLLGVADGVRVALGHRRHLFGARQLLEQALLEDVVELVRVHPHRFQVHRAAVGFALQILQRGVDLGAAGLVGGGEIGDHHANVG